MLNVCDNVRGAWHWTWTSAAYVFKYQSVKPRKRWFIVHLELVETFLQWQCYAPVNARFKR